jgi:hypothetical protein
MKLTEAFILFAALFQIVLAHTRIQANPFHGLLRTRRSVSWNATTPSISSGPAIDLGYGIYQGVYNSTSELNIFKGRVVQIFVEKLR